MHGRRLLPLSGVAFVVLILLPIVVIAPDTPDSGASGAELARFYDGEGTRQYVATSVLVASVPFLVLFAASLAQALPSRLGVSTIWERMLVAGSVLAAGAVLLTATAHMGLVSGTEDGFSHGALEALNAVDGNTWIALNGGLGVMLLGAAGLLLGRSDGYRWAGRTALVLGVVLFVPYATFFAMMLTGIWVFVMGIAVARSRTALPHATAPGAA